MSTAMLRRHAEQRQTEPAPENTEQTQKPVEQDKKTKKKPE